MQTMRSLRDYPKRGEIYIANLDPGFGHEIHKKRPVMIISHNAFNQTTPHVIMIPSSSSFPAILSKEIIPLGKPKGFDKASVLLPIFIRSIDKERLVKRIGKISKQKMMEVEEAVKLVLDIDQEGS